VVTARRDKKSPFVKLGDVLSLEAKRLGLAKGLRLRAFTALWRKAAPPELTRQTRPISYRAGTLMVEVDSAALMAELVNFRHKELLTLLRREPDGGRINDIRFQLKGK